MHIQFGAVSQLRQRMGTIDSDSRSDSRSDAVIRNGSPRPDAFGAEADLRELSVHSIRFLVSTLMVLAFQSPLLRAQPVTERIVAEQRTVTLANGETFDYEMGTLYLPENRGKPNSRTIAIGFARIKALHPTGAPPVFWLPGGPGLDVLGAFTESGEAAQARLRSWLSFRPVGDLVIVGQRGYTTRGEKLVEMSGASPLDRPASVQAEARAMRALAIRAVGHHADKDLSGYTIEAFAADVDALRKSLRYDRISLFGGSFGSQWSLAVMRFHPEIVARAVLSSVEPLNNGYDMPSHVVAALQRIAYDADRDAGLAPYLPQGGVMAAVRALQRRFASRPGGVVVRVAARDETGKRQVVVLGKEDLQLALLSRTSDAARWPASILSLYHGRYDEWARDTLQDRRAAPVTLIGPLVDSSVGVTAEREHQMRTDPATDLLGTGTSRAIFIQPQIGPPPTWATWSDCPASRQFPSCSSTATGTRPHRSRTPMPCCRTFPTGTPFLYIARDMTAPSTNCATVWVPNRRSSTSCAPARWARCRRMLG